MIMKTLNFRTAAAAVAALQVLTACSGGGGGGTGAAEKAAPAPSGNSSKEPVELVFYNASNSNATEDDFLKTEQGIEIKKKFPNVKIKFLATGKGTTPQDIVASGTPIDIIILSVYSFPVLIDAGLQYDMSDLIKKYKFDMNRFDPAAIEFVKQYGNGGIYGFPVAIAPTALFYNKDIFDKFGVSYPKDGMTWDQTYDLAKQLTRMDNGVQYYGFATRYPFMYNVNQLSLSYYDPKADKVTVANDKFKLFMENFARFSRIAGNEKANTDMFFKERNVAMSAYQFGRWGDFNSWDAVQLPSFNEAAGVGPQAYGTYWNISSTSKNKEVAFQVLAAMTTDEFQMQLSKSGTLPVVSNPEIVKAFGQDADGSNGKNLKGKHVQAFFYNKRAASSNVTKYDDVIAKRMNTAFNDIVTATKDPVTILREAEEASAKDVSTLKK